MRRRRDRMLLDKHHLTGPQFQVLRALLALGGWAGQRTLLEAMGAQEVSLSQITSRLAAQGVIRKEKVRGTGNCNQVAIRPSYLPKVQQAVADAAALEAPWAEILAPVGPALERLDRHMAKEALRVGS